MRAVHILWTESPQHNPDRPRAPRYLSDASDQSYLFRLLRAWEWWSKELQNVGLPMDARMRKMLYKICVESVSCQVVCLRFVMVFWIAWPSIRCSLRNPNAVFHVQSCLLKGVVFASRLETFWRYLGNMSPFESHVKPLPEKDKKCHQTCTKTGHQQNDLLIVFLSVIGGGGGT